MTRPRFALNVHGLGGVVFLLVAPFLVALGSGLALGWLQLMGAGFAAIGASWVWAAGRMGRLRDDRRLLDTGVPASVEVLAIKATSASTSRGRHGPVSRRVYRIDLDLHCPTLPPHRLRIYRDLPPAVGDALAAGMDLAAFVAADDPRRIALVLPEDAPRSDVDHLQAMQALQRRWADPTA